MGLSVTNICFGKYANIRINKLERLQRHEGIPMRPTPRCSLLMAEVTPTEA